MRSLLVVVVAACGAAPAGQPVQPVPPSEPAAPAAPGAPGARPARVVTVAIDNVLTDGPQPKTAAVARLEGGRDALAACGRTLEASIAVEVSFSMLSGGSLSHVRTFGTVPDALIACIRVALGSTEEEGLAIHEPTDVYALLVFQLAGLADPPRPTPPDLREDGEMLCSMLTRSGAMSAPLEERHEIAQAWFRSHIRHPVITRHTWLAATASPAEERRVLKSFRTKSKAQVCADPGW